MPTYKRGDVVVNVNSTRLEMLIRSAPQKADDVVEAAARYGEQVVKSSFGSGPAGSRYKRGSVIHVASQPGYPPNIDTGALSNSINVQTRGTARRAIAAGTEYAIALEYGTTRMAARPFMRPMAKKVQDKLPELFDRFGQP